MEPIEQRAAAVASFASTWQPEADALAELIATGWRPHLERAVGEALQAVQAQHAKERRRFTEGLAQSLRRLRTFESESQWSSALADAASLAAKRVIIFSINVDKLRFQAARGIEIATLVEVPLKQAAAFHSAVTTQEPAVALKTKGELSEPIAAIVHEDPSRRFAVYPVTMRRRVPAVVFAEDADPSLLDLIVTAAGASLESHMSAPLPNTNNAASIVSIAPAPFVSRDDEERHSRAQRFARVQVAEIRLYHSQAVKSGRASNNLYRALQPQLDGVRRVYQEQYLKNAPNMADYLHQEILRTLANGNSELLGPDYPGPLV